MIVVRAPARDRPREHARSVSWDMSRAPDRLVARARRLRDLGRNRSGGLGESIAQLERGAEVLRSLAVRRALQRDQTRRVPGVDGLLPALAFGEVPGQHVGPGIERRPAAAQRVGGAAMQLLAIALEQALVRGVADERVPPHEHWIGRGGPLEQEAITRTKEIHD